MMMVFPDCSLSFLSLSGFAASAFLAAISFSFVSIFFLASSIDLVTVAICLVSSSVSAFKPSFFEVNSMAEPSCLAFSSSFDFRSFSVDSSFSFNSSLCLVRNEIVASFVLSNSIFAVSSLSCSSFSLSRAAFAFPLRFFISACHVRMASICSAVVGGGGRGAVSNWFGASNMFAPENMFSPLANGFGPVSKGLGARARLPPVRTDTKWPATFMVLRTAMGNPVKSFPLRSSRLVQPISRSRLHRYFLAFPKCEPISDSRNRRSGVST
mmetsp:Transcript_18779/g.47756  ORF Transcript_18779/g.47756 Transcript_18779/m.47756 type:complete len:268 (+) Transcript_18779:431-1234(+)